MEQNYREQLKKLKREYKNQQRGESDVEQEPQRPRQSSGGKMVYCCNCSNCIVVERFGRTDRFCSVHLKSKKLFDVPNHIEYDYDHSLMCKKINVNGTCRDFCEGSEVKKEEQ
ncbi:MAG: hypothetical protein J5588_06315 [Bacteroidales bacterium]|nr:hypothetical protein [Bacteroidales bacterium]MBP5372428.1 hypothetical protein [Bacteroidales bacterium]